ncbi:MAG: D-alanyl-D-alanine carboxypeptidase family protein, partial [Minisyncoccia bacterium]
GEWSGALLAGGQNVAETIPDGRAKFMKILEYIAAPGTSRHHWGTDIDINGANISYFENEGNEEYLWLVQNAGSFGFCQTYRSKNLDGRTGYKEERWHWSYLPLSRGFTEEYKNLITNEDIRGFSGDQYASGEDLINNYVLSINPDCL